MKNNYEWGQTSLNRMKGVNELLTICVTRALSKSKYDMFIPWMGGVRTREEQHSIFLEGNSKCDGYKIESYHQSGNALDAVPVIGKYKNLRASNHFANLMLIEWQLMIGEGLTKMVMTWGGTFGENGWDKWHFEIK